MGLFLLQISLTIEVFCFNESDAFGKGAINHQHITREELVFEDFNDTADLDIQAFRVDKGSLASWTALNDKVILHVV